MAGPVELPDPVIRVAPARVPGMPPLASIVARAANGMIGAEGDLPWHEPADLRWFKRMTLGHAIIHGRRSFAAIGRPLPKRLNIVLTRDTSFQAPGCVVAHDLIAAIDLARAHDPMPFILGGAAVYAAAMPLLTRQYITEIPREVPGDTRYPAFDESAWDEVDRFEDAGLTFRTLDRIRADDAKDSP